MKTCCGIRELQSFPCRFPGTSSPVLHYHVGSMSVSLVHLMESHIFEEHLSNLEEVFSRILNREKLRDHVVFLGHVVSQQDIQLDPGNLGKKATIPSLPLRRETEGFKTCNGINPLTCIITTWLAFFTIKLL